MTPLPTEVQEEHFSANEVGKKSTSVTVPAFLKWSLVPFTYLTGNLRAASLRKVTHKGPSHLSGHRIYMPLITSPSPVKPQSSPVLDLRLSLNPSQFHSQRQREQKMS